MRKAWFALVIVLALATAAAAVGVRQLSTASSVHGSDLRLLTLVDESFCAASANGTTAGRAVRLQTCGVSAFQRFTFTDNADGTNSIADSQGMCLDGKLRTGGLPVTVSPCYFTTRYRWSYRPDGTIRNLLNGKCLRVSGAASNANVWLDTCKPSDVKFRWLVEH